MQAWFRWTLVSHSGEERRDCWEEATSCGSLALAVGRMNPVGDCAETKDLRLRRARHTIRFAGYRNSPVALIEGAWCALRSPIWLRGRRFRQLVECRRSADRRQEDTSPDVERRVMMAKRAASVSLRLLALIPASPWKNTCLYRSVAECLIRRRHGDLPRLRFGVRRRGPDTPIEAHAWVHDQDAVLNVGDLATFRRSAVPMTDAGPSESRWELLRHGSMQLVADRDLVEFVKPWIPHSRQEGHHSEDVGRQGEIRVRSPRFPEATSGSPLAEPDLQLGTAGAWVEDQEDRSVIRNPGDRVRGEVDLDSCRAVIELTAPGGLKQGDAKKDDLIWELFSTLTLTSALLLGRLDYTLVHAGGAVAPDGRSWLLAGDAWSGKSTVCASLIAGGWNYLADDQIVLGTTGGEVWAEGWPRDFHLDRGWWDSEPDGRRRKVDPEELGPGKWQPAAPVGGVLLPELSPEEPTRLLSCAAADALTLLVRQSPWLLCDRKVAEPLLDLLIQTVRRPTYRLRLGRDAFGDPATVLRQLEAAGIVS